ncbi:MAG TPA: PAS domain S-box protein [Anaerolineaceae bacterium]
MTQPLRILFVEDLPTDQELAEWQLRAEGLDFISLRVETRDAFLQALDDFQPNLIISDYAMPEFDGMQALELTRQLKSDIPFIILTGSMNEDTAVECIKAGASDYVIKEHVHRLPFAVQEALKQQQVRKEKEQAEEQLSESEIRYRNLIMHSPDAIFIDHQDSIILVNQACIKLFGAQKEEELIGKSPFDFFHPDYHKKMKDRIHHLRELNEPVPVIEEKIIRLDGRIVDVDVLAAPFSFGGSNYGHVILRDITERKQAEQQLHLQATALNSAANAILITDREGTIEWINPAFTLLTGYSAEEAIGQNPRILKSGVQDQPYYEKLWTTILAGQVWRSELVNKCKDGSLYTEEETITPLIGSNGQINHFIDIKIDITERKRAEVALKDANAKLTRAQRIAHIGSWNDYLPTNQLDWSEEMYRIFGFPLNTPVNLAEVSRVFPPEELERFQKAVGAAINADEPYSMDYKIIRPDGAVRHIHDEGEVVRDEQGKAISMYGATQDITERRQAEKLQDAIYRITQAADQAESPDSLFPSIHAVIQEVMVADNFYIALIDEKNDLLSFPYSVDEGDPQFPPKKPGKGLTEYVLRAGKSVLCDEALYEGLRQRGEIELVGVHSPIWLGVPLIVEGKVIGVMVVQDYKNARAYGEREQRILEFVSSQVAMAIHRKQQEAEIIKNIQDINLLYEAGKQLSQSLDLQHIYLTFYKLISSTMKCDTLYIAGFDSQSELISAKFAFMEGKPVDVSAFPAIPLEPEGHGIQSPVIRSGKSSIINNYADALKQTKTNYLINEEGEIVEEGADQEDVSVTQSSLIVPILLNNQVTGVVQVQSCEKDAYSVENLKIAEALASQIAVAANNAQLYQQSLNEIEARIQAESSLRNHAQRQEKMAFLGRELAATLDLETIYRTAERHVKAMIDCPNFCITLFDPQRMILTAAYFMTNGVMVDPSTLPPLQYNPQPTSSGHSKAIADKAPMIVHDLAANRKAGGGMPVGSEQELETAIYVPILVADEVIGLLDLQSCHKDAYSEEDGEWLSVVANQIGLAIQNARQLAQTRQRVAELLVMHNIDQAITSSDDPIKTYQIVLEQVATQPYVDGADILFFDPQENLLTFIAGYGFSSPVVATTRLHLGEGLAGKAALDKRLVLLLNPTDENPGFFGRSLWKKEGFVAYLGLPLIFHGELKGVLEIFSRKLIPAEPEWMNFMGSLAQQVAIAVDNSQLFHGLQQANIELLQAYDATIAGWSQAMDLRDKETEGHTERVAYLTMEIARTLGLNEEKLVHVHRGALLHDIGKLGVPDRILHKPGALTDEEWVIMKKHPVFAYEMLSSIDYLHPALAIPYCHHEKWDGTGYPRGLKGQQIPLEARIFALVDVYDALTADRPYRAAWSQEKTLAYIQEQSGKHFDPKITAAFSVLLRKLKP